MRISLTVFFLCWTLGGGAVAQDAMTFAQLEKKLDEWRAASCSPQDKYLNCRLMKSVAELARSRAGLGYHLNSYLTRDLPYPVGKPDSPDMTLAEGAIKRKGVPEHTMCNAAVVETYLGALAGEFRATNNRKPFTTFKPDAWNQGQGTNYFSAIRTIKAQLVSHEARDYFPFFCGTRSGGKCVLSEKAKERKVEKQCEPYLELSCAVSKCFVLPDQRRRECLTVGSNQEIADLLMKVDSSSAMAKAAATLGIGEEQGWKELLPGDVVTFDRQNSFYHVHDKHEYKYPGHSAIFISYVDGAFKLQPKYNEKTTKGYVYFSSQGTQPLHSEADKLRNGSGFGFRVAFYQGHCPTSSAIITRTQKLKQYVEEQCQGRAGACIVERQVLSDMSYCPDRLKGTPLDVSVLDSRPPTDCCVRAGAVFAPRGARFFAPHAWAFENGHKGLGENADKLEKAVRKFAAASVAAAFITRPDELSTGNNVEAQIRRIQRQFGVDVRKLQERPSMGGTQGIEGLDVRGSEAFKQLNPNVLGRIGRSLDPTIYETVLDKLVSTLPEVSDSDLTLTYEKFKE